MMTKEAKNSLDIGAREGDAEAVIKLLESGVQFDHDTVWAALEGKSPLPVVQALLNNGMDVDYDLGHSGNILIRAIYLDDPSLVKLLLSNGADLHDEGAVQSHSTLAIAQSPEVAELLLSHPGAKIKGSGALALAASRDDTTMIKFWLSSGADVNEIQETKWTNLFDRERGIGTALHIAAEEGAVDSVELLLKHGADQTIKDSNGKTACERAEAAEKTEIVAMLSSR